MQISEYISGHHYALCICEGRAEEDLINYLLDHDRLIFKRSDLIFGKVTRSRGVKKIQDEYLSLDFEKPVFIFRIVDSKNERFKLDTAFEGRYSDKVFNIITRPEIEILIIIKNNDYGAYTNRSKTKLKPSEYCQSAYKIKKIKSEGIFINAFSHINELVKSIEEYKRLTGSREYNLSDILSDF